MTFNKLQSLEESITRSYKLYLSALLFLLVLYGVKNAFVQDDAFISFRYAYNLVHHNNFSWNPTDTVKLEGYTNFLWTIIMAGCMSLGLDPVICSMAIGIMLGLGTLIFTFKIGELIFGDTRYALLSVLLLGTNYSFSGYMTGGLETQLQTFLLSAVTFSVFSVIQNNGSPIRHFLSIGLFSALAILTRLDSPLIIGLLILPMLYFRFRQLPERKVQQTMLSLVLMAIPVLLIVIPWLWWKYNYYGDLLPNSFYLKGKVFSGEVFKNGLYYIFTFFTSYYLIIFVFIIAFQFWKLIRNKFMTTGLIVISGWLAYILKVGGDFMEFRFFVPILPLLMITIVWSISQLEGKIVKYILVLTLLCGSLSHQILFFDFHGTDSIKKLHGIIYEKETNWKGVGIRFNELFYSVKDKIVIATSAAGAIPYYSKLNTIDMFGVNDRWIALNGEVTKHFKPGHHRWGKLDYYFRTNVNIIVGHPELRPVKWSEGREKLALVDFDNFRIPGLNKNVLPSETRILEIPIDGEYSLFALYLKPLKEIDDVITNNNIRSFEID